MCKLRQVLHALKEAGLTLKLSKCKFGMEKVEFLGFEISANGVEPGSNKVDAISLFKIPRDVHAVRRFLGLTSFFRRFISGFAKIAAPMTTLTRKNEKFQWGSSQQSAFDELKHRLTSNPVLRIYSPTSIKTELHTDASSEGLGAMLLQADDEGIMRLVYAISRRTSEVESRYHSSKLELMAVVWAVERLRAFLIGIKFDVVTDCQSLVFLNTNKTKNPQVARWSNTLCEYDCNVRHRKGELMQHVDALSRDPIEEAFDGKSVTSVFSIVRHEEEILIHQRSDPEVKRKTDILEKTAENRTKAERGEIVNYKLLNGLLYKTVTRDNRTVDLYVVPSAMRKSIAIKYHDLANHFGIEKTLARMQLYYFFPNMREYVKRHISRCLPCILSKKPRGRQPGELHPIPPGHRPFAIVHVDHLGPFPTSARGNKHVLVLIDNLTKFVTLEAVKSTETVTTIKRFEDFVNRFGAPNRIVCDRGTSFTAENCGKFCEKHGIKLTFNSSRHPQANGLVERMNQTILAPMRAAAMNGRNDNWDRELMKIARDVNSTVNKTTGKAPYEVLYGYLPRFEEGSLRELTENCETYRMPNEVQNEVREAIEKTQKCYKKRYDAKRNVRVIYELGDIVFWSVNPTATGESTKLQSRYRGPYVVVQKLPSDTYEIERLSNKRKTAHRITAHVSQLKIWRGEDHYENESDEERNSEDERCERKESDSDKEKDAIDEHELSNFCEPREVRRDPVNKEIKDVRPKRKIQTPARLNDYIVM